MTEAGEVEQEQVKEPDHPGWQHLAKVLDATNELFDKCHFLLEYGFSSNIYVLRGDYLTIVDPGNDYSAFMELFALDFEPSDVKKVVLTHGHRDHAMGAFELLRSYPSIKETGGFELLLHEAGPPELKEVAKEFGCRVTEVRGGETLELSGLELEVIHTPGHTIDGLCLYHAPSKTAFTGDTVMPHAMAEPDKNAGGNLEHYLFAARLLLKRDIENVLPGHGGPVAGAGRRVIEETYEGVIMKTLGVEKEVPWLEGASELAEKGLLEESVFCCNKELAVNPDNLEALQLKALALNDLGRCDEAIEAIDKVLAQRSDDPFALLGKGYALLGLGKHEEALKHFDDALRINPDIKEARIYRGMALYYSGRYEEAMDIDDFKNEFIDRFKSELERKDQALS